MNYSHNYLKVSVCVMTYNQEKYIRQCLQSIVNQETDFDFEIIVGEDCSTDETRAIVQEFVEKYPSIVKSIFHDKNVGITKNYFSVHNSAKGEYVCHCDGDDYWLPGKLRWQSKYLDENPDVVQVWHRMLILDDNNQGWVGMPIRFFRFFFGKKIDTRDLALSYGLVGQHSSQMYRRSARNIIKYDKEFIDYYTAIDVSRSGKSIIMNNIFGVYRMPASKESMTSNNEGRLIVDKALVNIATDFSIDNDFQKRFLSYLALRLLMNVWKKRQTSIIWNYLKKQKFKISIRYFFMALIILLAHRF